MNAQTILSDFISHVTPSMHYNRRNALVDVTDSLLSGNPLTVTALGRGLKGNAYEKHKIKKSDRLLSNSHLQTERIGIYRAITALFSAHLPHPVILVDWSDMDTYGRHFLLRASLAFSGRSITLYEEIHTRSTKEKPRTHKQFLSQLSAMLPKKCKPIIITDAGFRVPWFQQVKALGWDFIGRIRNRNKCQKNQYSQWINCKSLYAQATTTPSSLGEWRLTKTNQFPVQFVIVKEAQKGRHALNRNGQKKASSASKKAALRESEPWLLATSLPVKTVGAVKYVVNGYTTRMQIEEAFRDLKSVRWGFAGNLQATRKEHRLSVLMLVATLAHIVVLLSGLAVVSSGQAGRYQVNTLRKRRVLSLCFLGYRAWQNPDFHFTPSIWKSVITLMGEILLELHGPRYV